MRLLKTLRPQGAGIFAHAGALSRLFPSPGSLETRSKAINPLTQDSRASQQDTARQTKRIPNKPRLERAEPRGGSGLFRINRAGERLP